VTPLSIAALSGDKVYGELFSLTDESEMGHIRLSREADLIVVAPASADLIAKMAGGHADDLASTVLLATDKKVLIAPTMNTRMWLHPATRRNLAVLEQDGIAIIAPAEGDLACGEVGRGRMVEPTAIIAAIEQALAAPGEGPLAAVRALVTSGPTHEPIDPVRYLANRSSGKQGHAIAAALGALGAEVTLVTGPTAEADPPRARVIRIETAEQMLAACAAALPVDVAVCAAAVADWRIAGPANRKTKRDGKPPRLELVENPDILKTLSRKGKKRPTLVIGFAAETEEVIANAKHKRLDKGCDWILANDVSAKTGVFGGARNQVHLIDQHGVESWPAAAKTEIAQRLARRIADAISAKGIAV
jgi:phosphopantothenoylcysteine decarboxylase/phosphopantothenate--cysteine ligase